MDETELVEVLQSYKDAIGLLEEKFNAFSEEIGHVREELQARIESLEDTVINGIINPAHEAAEKAAYDRDLEDFKGRYSEKIDPYLDKIKAVEGDDFDIFKTAFDGYKEYKDANGDKALDEVGYVDELLSGIASQLDKVKELINAENVEVKQDEDGNTELKADGETVAEEGEKTETPEDTTEEPLGEPAELSEDEMKKLEEEMKAEGLV
jgi:hypothetical protein